MSQKYADFFHNFVKKQDRTLVFEYVKFGGSMSKYTKFDQNIIHIVPFMVAMVTIKMVRWLSLIFRSI